MAGIDGGAFLGALERFSELVEAKSDHPFPSFDEGLAAVWENYKPRLRDHALGILSSGDWVEDEIGSGAILNRATEAIEIRDSRHTNNVAFRQEPFRSCQPGSPRISGGRIRPRPLRRGGGGSASMASGSTRRGGGREAEQDAEQIPGER